MTDILQILIHFVVTLLFALLFLLTAATLLSYLDRKVMAWMQDRQGPLHNGPQGLLQAPFDVLKLLLKEDVFGGAAKDSIVFRLAPMIFFAPVITAYVALPFSPYVTGSALATGIVYYVALSSLDVIGVFMAGWGSNNKYSLIGGLRSTAQMISYELPLVLALVGPVMLTSALAAGCSGAHPNLNTCSVGSISFTQIVAAQMRPGAPWLWFALLQPLGLLIYYIAGLAETNRAPFDLPEAESELVAGYLTEYSGMRWAMFFLGEYGNMTIVSAITTAVFLGGWSGPGAAVGFWTGLLGSFGGQLVFNVIAVFWFIVKMTVLLLAFIWVRATVPRLRADQLMQFAWLILIPLTLFNIVLTGALLLLPIGQTGTLVASAAANWLLTLFFVFGLRRVARVSPFGRVPRWKRADRARKVVVTAPGKSPAELAGSRGP
ncbi:MAG TPA: complex I subunit 1 family protein [Ktedonobacterales bacterium]|nr:complex I subunit 1 family protein [Ktedonobacterales bacterium]